MGDAAHTSRIRVVVAGATGWAGSALSRGIFEAPDMEIVGAISRTHSVRLPSFVISVESLFGADGERLTIRHDAGSSAEPYVAGALLAIRGVGGLLGVHRGLDVVMDETGGM